MPAAPRDLYADGDLASKPADHDGRLIGADGQEWRIARSSRTGATGPSPCHIMGGDTVRVANSLRDFLTRPRRSGSEHRDPEA